MELSIEELNKLLEAAAERGALKALQTFTGTQPAVIGKTISPAARYPNLAQMSSKDYWMAEKERVKLENKAIRASGDKTKKIIRLGSMRKDPIFMAKFENEFLNYENARFEKMRLKAEKEQVAIHLKK